MAHDEGIHDNTKDGEVTDEWETSLQASVDEGSTKESLLESFLSGLKDLVTQGRCQNELFAKNDNTKVVDQKQVRSMEGTSYGLFSVPCCQKAHHTGWFGSAA